MTVWISALVKSCKQPYPAHAGFTKVLHYRESACTLFAIILRSPKCTNANGAIRARSVQNHAAFTGLKPKKLIKQPTVILQLARTRAVSKPASPQKISLQVYGQTQSQSTLAKIT